MYKILIFLCISLLSSLSANVKSEKIEIFATTIETEDNIITASEEVIVVYQDYFLSAKKAIYNKNNGDLELFDNVRANQASSYKILGNYAKLNVIDKKRMFKPFYMLEEDMKVWISAKNAEIQDKDFEISSGVVSGCAPENAIWKMEFTSSDYDLDSKWLNLYNTRLLIYDIPVFYTPWFGYPLNKERRSGLLKPTLGYSSDEGFLYQQPIYIAPSNNWDLEVIPQLRTNRGKGFYSTLRFADSAYSKGSLNIGYFEEKEEYFLENNLANQNHKGFHFTYANSNFLNEWMGLDFEGKSGIYADIGYMNDVDYINLKANNILNIATATQVLSQVNIFYNNSNNYYGAYFKYYQDLTKESNAETLQQLPVLHYHHYLETLLSENILYNIDVHVNNIHREEGIEVTQTDINIPLSIHTDFFDEYLDVTLSTNMYLQHSAFRKGEIYSPESTNGLIAKNDNKIEISTSLTKAYEKMSHVISFGANYNFNGSENRTGFYEENQNFCDDIINRNSPRCEFYNISQKQRESQVYFSQYIYDSLGEEVFYHRVAQSIIYGEEKSFGDIENELEVTWNKHVTFYNNTFYNHNEKQLSSVYNSIRYTNDSLSASVSHLYKDTFLNETQTYSPHTSYLTSLFRYKYNTHYSYHMSFMYDIELEIAKRKEIGFLYSKRCWDFGIKYVENNRPVLQRDSSGMSRISNIPEKYIYLTVSLKPFMSSGDNPFFAYKLSESE